MMKEKTILLMKEKTILLLWRLLLMKGKKGMMWTMGLWKTGEFAGG